MTARVKSHESHEITILCKYLIARAYEKLYDITKRYEEDEVFVTHIL